MSVITSIERYNCIKSAVDTEVNRLFPSPEYNGSSRSKAQAINSAMNRLYAVVMQQNPTGSGSLSRRAFSKIDPKELHKIDLSTIDSMLDAQISEWYFGTEPSMEQGMEFDGRRSGYYTQISLRTALNIANNNFFNILGGTWGPLWGKAIALENVEIELDSLKLL